MVEECITINVMGNNAQDRDASMFASSPNPLRRKVTSDQATPGAFSMGSHTTEPKSIPLKTLDLDIKMDDVSEQQKKRIMSTLFQSKSAVTTGTKTK